MDETTEQLLRSWGFEEYLEKFRDEGIDQEALLAISPHSKEIEQLITKIGPRSKFQKALATFQAIMSSKFEVISTTASEAQSDAASELISLDLSSIEDLTGNIKPVEESLPPIIITEADFGDHLMQRQITGLQSLDKSPERPQNIETNEEQNKENLQPDDHHCNQPKNQKVEVIPVQISEVDLNSGNVLFDSSLHSLDLKKLLNELIFGKVTLSIYEIRKDFDESTRRKLVDLIITSLLSKTDPLNQPIQYKNHHFDELANKIIGLFPSEAKEIYYVAPHREGSQQKISKGKLVDAYRNRLRQLKKAGLHRGRKRKIEETEEESDSIDAENKRVSTVHQDWLRHNTVPWESVVEHWNASRALRKSDFHKAIGNVNSIIEAWPVVKQPLGYTLLESDYNYMFNDGLSLYSEWPMLSTKLENLMRSEIKEKAYVPFLDNLKDSDITPDSRDAILLSLLPVICPPSTVVRLAKGSWKPSCAESINGFILHVKVPGDLEMARDQQREKMAKIKQPLQPHVIVLGPRLSAIEHSYVNVDETLYLVESPLKAVDICYKIFQVLNATYPPQSEQVWLFLQKYVYKRTTRWDKQVKSVIILTGKLNQANKENSRSGEPESQN